MRQVTPGIGETVVTVSLSVGARIVWMILWIGAGAATFILVGGLLAATVGGGYLQAGWAIPLAAGAAVPTGLALWRMFRVALILDETGITVRNYLRDRRFKWHEISAAQMILEERGQDDVSDIGSSLLGSLLEALTGANACGVRLLLRNGQEPVRARATFRRVIDPAMVGTLRAYFERYQTGFQNDVDPRFGAVAPPPRQPKTTHHDDAILGLSPERRIHDRVEASLDGLKDQSWQLMFVLVSGIIYVLTVFMWAVGGLLPARSWQFWFVIVVGIAVGWYLPGVLAYRVAQVIARLTPRGSPLAELSLGVIWLEAVIIPAALVISSIEVLLQVAPAASR